MAGLLEDRCGARLASPAVISLRTGLLRTILMSDSPRDAL